MRARITAIGIVALLLSLTTCSPVPTYNADTLTSMLSSKSGMATLVVFYPYSYAWSDRVADVKTSGVPGCRLKSGTFTLQDIAPGKQTVNVSLCNGNAISTFTLVAKAGEKYYIQTIPNDKSAVGRIAQYNSNVKLNTGKAHVEGPAFFLDLVDESYATGFLMWEKQATQ